MPGILQTIKSRWAKPWQNKSSQWPNTLGMPSLRSALVPEGILYSCLASSSHESLIHVLFNKCLAPVLASPTLVLSEIRAIFH